VSRPTRGHRHRFPLRGYHPLRPAFPDGSGTKRPCHWPGPRSLATTSGVSGSLLSQRPLLMSFPPATEMFQFAGFASLAYGFSQGYRLRGGLPHSDIPGSTIARISPGLFAACHVLHRLSVPRHPPDALTSRLSATPNGKNHRRRNAGVSPRRQAKPKGFRRKPRPTAPLRRRPLSPGAANSSLEKTLTGSRETTGRTTAQPAEYGLPPRSHNLLLHNGKSTIRPGIPIRDFPGQSFLLAAYPSVQLPPPPFGEATSQRPCPGAFGATATPAFRRSCASPVGAAKPAVSPVVEVNGIEPMTSCLQSRRSPRLSYTPGVARQHRRDRRNRKVSPKAGCASVRLSALRCNACRRGVCCANAGGGPGRI
jgi:hypothetical protein